MTTETTTTTPLDAGELVPPADGLAGSIGDLLGIDTSIVAGAAAMLGQALETLNEINTRAHGIETVLRLVLAGAPMTPKMRRRLVDGLHEAGLDPDEWLP